MKTLTLIVWGLAGVALAGMLLCVFWPWPKRRIDWKRQRDRRIGDAKAKEREMSAAVRRVLLGAKNRNVQR